MFGLENVSIFERLIEKFGFPIFCVLCCFFILWRVWIFMSKQMTKKDCDFLEYMQRRDAQVEKMSDAHNFAFRENTIALNKLRASIDVRNDVTQTNTKALLRVSEKYGENGE